MPANPTDELREAGEYLIGLYRRLWLGGVVRDLAEAEAAWASAKSRAALQAAQHRLPEDDLRAFVAELANGALEEDGRLLAGRYPDTIRCEARDLIELAQRRLEDVAGMREVIPDNVAEACRLVEYDMLNRQSGNGDGFFGQRKEVATIINYVRARAALDRNHRTEQND